MIGCQILFNYLLVSVLELGVGGLGLAAILGRLTPLVVSLSVCFIMVRNGQFAWNGFSTRALLGWKPMIKLGVSGAINAFAELALFEISIFFSQFDGTNTLAVVIIVMQLSSALWSIALGMSRASATLIGTALVEGDADKTRYYMKLTILNSAILSATLTILTYCLRNYEVLLFSNDVAVKDLFVASYWVICILVPIDHTQTALNQGILVAFGAQRFTAWSMSIACYVIGLPIILVTIFLTDLKVTGIFIGVTIVALIMVITASVKIWKVDIDKEIGKSMKRASNSKGKQSDRVDDVGAVGAAEIHENPACTANIVEKESTIMETIEIKEEDKDEQDIDNAGENCEHTRDDKCVSFADGQGSDCSDFNEKRYVIFSLVAALLVSVILTGVSFIRQ